MKPFLSYKREDSQEVNLLYECLRVFGAGGWKDTDDLQIGVQTEKEIREVICSQSGGFIWYGTRKILDSDFINRIEIPTALKRRKIDPLYPMIPLFVDLDPSNRADRICIKKAIGRRGRKILCSNGMILEPQESLESFRRKVAKRYVVESINSLDPNLQEVLVEIRMLSEPSGRGSLTIDWRSLIEANRRLIEPYGEELITDALRTVRGALQRRYSSIRIVLDQDLPLPVGFLVGYEWRATTRIELVIRQRTGASFDYVESRGGSSRQIPFTRQSLMGEGPVVLSVSCGRSLGNLPEQYSKHINARELIRVHAANLLSSNEIRGLARACADELSRINNCGISEKHLLMLGPSSLAILTGAASNAVGPITIPFWNGSEYVNPIIVGQG